MNSRRCNLRTMQNPINPGGVGSCNGRPLQGRKGFPGSASVGLHLRLLGVPLRGTLEFIHFRPATRLAQTFRSARVPGRPKTHTLKVCASPTTGNVETPVSRFAGLLSSLTWRTSYARTDPGNQPKLRTPTFVSHTHSYSTQFVASKVGCILMSWHCGFIHWPLLAGC